MFLYLVIGGFVHFARPTKTELFVNTIGNLELKST